MLTTYFKTILIYQLFEQFFLPFRSTFSTTLVAAFKVQSRKWAINIAGMQAAHFVVAVHDSKRNSNIKDPVEKKKEILQIFT